MKKNLILVLLIISNTLINIGNGNYVLALPKNQPQFPKLYSWDNFKVAKFSSTRSMPDSIVTIYGKAFGVTRDSVKVFFDENIAEVASINDTVIEVKVPDIEPGNYNIRLSLKDTSVSLNPFFSLVKSKYIFNSFTVQVNNILCHQDYSSEWRSGDESGSSSREDTVLKSFQFVPFSQFSENISDGNLIHYYCDIYSDRFGVSFRVRGQVDNSNNTVLNFNAYKNEYLDEQDGMGGTYQRDIHNVSIGLLNCTIVSDTKIKSVMNREMLEKTTFSFGSSNQTKMSTSSNTQNSMIQYTFISFTDSTEVIITMKR